MPTAAIMFQGTGSDVGKSLIVAGLCRLYARQSPATINDLPTSDPVPWNMMAAGWVISRTRCPSAP